MIFITPVLIKQEISKKYSDQILGPEATYFKMNNFYRLNETAHDLLKTSLFSPWFLIIIIYIPDF